MTSIVKTKQLYILAAIFTMFVFMSTMASAQTSSMMNPQKAARIDVCFLLDSTGSMADEIDVVKEKIWEIVNDILLGDPKPDVRFSIVTYRDRGDEYVVKTVPFSRDVDRIHADLMQIRATGGGDKREDVNKGFRTAVNDLEWDNRNGVARMIFLIGDAGPHMEYSQTVPYDKTAKIATNKGIQVYSIGCSGINQSEIREFTEIASLTGGQFEFLTYKMDIEQDGERKTLLITGDDASIAEPDMLTESEWRKGGTGLKEEGKVRGAKKSEKIYYKDAVTGEDKEAGVSEMTSSYATQSMENNLDTVIRRQIQIQAEMQGAKYDDSELSIKIKETTVIKKRKPWYVRVADWFSGLFD